MVRRARALSLATLLLLLSIGPAGTQPRATASITSPTQQFGAAIGDDYFLATWRQFEDYWKKLDRESNRMALVDLGKTEEGRSQWMAVITAPENFPRLERYKAISRRLARAEGLTDEDARSLAQEGRAVVWIDGGLHADEVLGAQQLIEIVYQLVSANDAETQRFLRDVIVLAVHANPDGHALVGDWYMRERVPTRRTLAGLPRLYQKYAGHDNNRDFYMSTQAETINMNRVLYHEWFPQIVYNHHQSAPPGTVMFAPPFRDPFNYVYDPLIPVGIDLVAAAMHARFAAEGKRGVTMRSGATYSTWWNGGLRTTVYFHNQIGLLTETIGSPTPMDIPFVRERQRPTADLPLPIAPQTWRFRQSIDYSMTANRAVLDVASRYRETLLYNIYRMGMNSIERGSRDSWTVYPHRPLTRTPDPGQRDARGYILPSDQPDFPTATKFVNTLIRNGIDVHRATAVFSVGSKTYPAGSFVVKAAQAFRPHVLDMFEPQDHPDDIPYPGASPTPPYDSAGWTLAFQMGVAFDRVLDGFDGPFEKLTAEVGPPAGRVVPAGRPASAGKVADAPAGYLVSHHQNDAFVAVNRLLQAGEEVYWPRDRAIGGAPRGAGAMYVATKPSTRARLEKAAVDLGLTFTGVEAAPGGDALRLRPVRIGLADQYGGSPASGWIRWLLERYEFPFDVVYPSTLDEGRLARRFDVLIFADDLIPERERLEHREPENLPEAYRGRTGVVTLAKTVPALEEFVEDGGTLLAIGGSTSIASHLRLGITSALVEPRGDGSMQPLTREKYYVPGSILRVRVDNGSPLGYGFDTEVDVFFDNSPVMRLQPDAAARRVAWFATASPLRSGWAWGQHYLREGVAAAEVTRGRGRVLLFGPQITFRAQPHGTFKFLFNGILYPTAEPARIQ
ncbi:MAG TPA: M14 metallopeptidase family protein [Vicinamibacterales bacterium]